MHNTYSTWEGLFVYIIEDSGKKITICNNNHVSSPVVHTLSKISKNVVLAGDFNIDLLKLNYKSKYQEFYDIIYCQNLISYL